LSTDTPKTPPFSREMQFQYGVLTKVAPGLRRLVCRNPSPFTFKGTNLYVIGEGNVAVIDPGPVEGDHLDVLTDALKGETITHIVLTHGHSDHSGAVAALKGRTGAMTSGMARAAGDPAAGARGPSGRSFVTPVAFDLELRHGDRIAGDGWEIEAIHTPGHAPDHLCFHIAAENILLSGDHVMGWNTTVIAPPEGHMGSYLGALDLLLNRNEPVFFPGHGGPILEPQRFVKALIFHRRWRESEIMECLRTGVAKIEEMVPRMYSGIEPALSKAAALSVFAQLEYMVEKGTVSLLRPGPFAMDQEFGIAV
jgi:glyoxylase-like metal-dependent hydrolase (beta-lactamase superfamily II)